MVATPIVVLTDPHPLDSSLKGPSIELDALIYKCIKAGGEREGGEPRLHDGI